ncbi:MAG: tetratricopeptide repeat protein, partial [Planctomycetota bacterium]
MKKRTFPKEAQDLAGRAEAAMRDGNYIRSLALWDQVIEQVPEAASLRAGRADALLQLGSVAEAMEEAQRAVEADEDYLPGHWVLALTAAQLEQTARADRAFQRAVILSFGDGMIISEYAHFLAAQGDPGVAEEMALRAVRAAPGFAGAWAALGYSQFRRERACEAESNLKHALELDPHDGRAKA